MNIPELILALLLAIVIYIVVCFGRIASSHNKNPVVYGIISILFPINLIILGYWAFFANSKGQSLSIKEDLKVADQAEKGVVKWFSEKKGYGFISREKNKGDIFVHHSAIGGKGFKKLNEGDCVEFTISKGQKGPAADNVRKI